MDITALFTLSYGLYVLGVQTEGGLGGCVVDAVAQVALGDPSVVVVASMRNNVTNQRLHAAGACTLSVLPAKVDPFVIANFGFQSARDVDKWANVPHTLRGGLPVLDGAVAFLRLAVQDVKELTTHSVFFCDVADAWHGDRDARPLIYADYQRDMKTATMQAFNEYKRSGHAPVPKEKAVWRCPVCGYAYQGNTPFEDLANDWRCPLCGAPKGQFKAG
ncbi:MAG: flavin reductase [Oscillospiraceae bacterium]|jgi:flavin reductase (DIM6/NTAB) family NADH-FMN oxidoreductase RutF/rubredoxin|nr:flavin reductase [Oscillospiraceae bacterium]